MSTGRISVRDAQHEAWQDAVLYIRSLKGRFFTIEDVDLETIARWVDDEGNKRFNRGG